VRNGKHEIISKKYNKRSATRNKTKSNSKENKRRTQTIGIPIKPWQKQRTITLVSQQKRAKMNTTRRRSKNPPKLSGPSAGVQMMQRERQPKATCLSAGPTTRITAEEETAETAGEATETARETTETAGEAVETAREATEAAREAVETAGEATEAVREATEAARDGHHRHAEKEATKAEKEPTETSERRKRANRAEKTPPRRGSTS
jgi:hypothetical protein